MEIEESLASTIPQESEIPDTIPQNDTDMEIEQSEGGVNSALPDTIPQESALPETQMQEEAGASATLTKENLPIQHPLNLELLDMNVLKKVVFFILTGIDLNTFGQKELRAEIEQIYGWQRKSLKKFKTEIRSFCVEYVNAQPVREDDPPPPRKRKKKRRVEPAPEDGPRQVIVREPRRKKKKKSKNLLDVDHDLEAHWQIYTDENDNDRVYSVMLNQTDLAYNVKGHNKFYAIQLLQSYTVQNRCKLICKWGRVGVSRPQESCKDFNTLLQAKGEFKKKFKAKTGNIWGSAIFHPYPKKYVIVDVVSGDDDDMGWEDIEVSYQTSKLAKPVFDLVKMMCSRRLAAAHLKSLDVDVDRFPLGNLSADQIKAGYQILCQLSRKLESDSPNAQEICDYSSKFYTLIPHDFGMSRPPPIRTRAHLQKKIQLVELLAELQKSSHIFALRSGAANLVDLHYNALHCKISPLEVDDPTFVTLEKMVGGTHAPTHADWKLDVKGIFSLERPGEKLRNSPFQCLPNRRLLWHGSRTSNFIGILAQGLRIAPKEAPRTGYMFGKGIYFADLSSKSAQYCHATKDNPYGLLLLADVALGNMHEKLEAEYLDRAPKYFHSVWGRGKMAPTQESKVDVDGCDAYLGPARVTDVESSSLNYNEFIVYDVGQVLLKYLVLVKFEFK